MFLLPAQKSCNGKMVAEALARISKTPCSPAVPPQTGFFLGGCNVSPKGIIALPEDCSSEDAAFLCRELLEEGFTYYPSENSPLLVDGANIPVDYGTEGDYQDPRPLRNDGINYWMLSMDQGELSEYDLIKLEKAIAGKASLLKKTLEADELPIIRQNGKLFFPWFINHGTYGELQAYTDLIDRLVNYARCRQRISAKDRPTPNETREMGIFLTTLGMPENKYPRSRKLLLRNLNSASTDRDFLISESGKKYLPAPRVYLHGQPLDTKLPESP